jgi:tRNA U55 pseudouridine synthase TruB
VIAVVCGSPAARAPISAAWPRTSGDSLGCGAHLTALRRVAVGALVVADAVTLDQLAALAEDGRERWLLPPDTLLQSLPVVSLDDDAAARFAHGNPVGSSRGARPENAGST